MQEFIYVPIYNSFINFVGYELYARPLYEMIEYSTVKTAFSTAYITCAYLLNHVLVFYVFPNTPSIYINLFIGGVSVFIYSSRWFDSQFNKLPALFYRLQNDNIQNQGIKLDFQSSTAIGIHELSQFYLASIFSVVVFAPLCYFNSRIFLPGVSLNSLSLDQIKNLNSTGIVSLLSIFALFIFAFMLLCCFNAIIATANVFALKLLNRTEFTDYSQTNKFWVDFLDKLDAVIISDNDNLINEFYTLTNVFLMKF